MNFAASWVQFSEQVSATTSIDGDRGCESVVVDLEWLDLGRGSNKFFGKEERKKWRNEETKRFTVFSFANGCSIFLRWNESQVKWRNEEEEWVK